MTITINELRRNEPTDINNSSVYCPEKSQVSYELSLMDRKIRGETLERCIAEKIEHNTGYECNALSGNQAWDITANLDDSPYRIEVKSSLKHTVGSSYNITNLKPNNFDYVFIILVTPTGCIVKWALSEDVKKVCKKRTRHSNGYKLTFMPTNIPDYFYDLEDFPYNY